MGVTWTTNVHWGGRWQSAAFWGHRTASVLVCLSRWFITLPVFSSCCSESEPWRMTGNPHSCVIPRSSTGFLYSESKCTLLTASSHCFLLIIFLISLLSVSALGAHRVRLDNFNCYAQGLSLGSTLPIAGWVPLSFFILQALKSQVPVRCSCDF